MANFVGLCTFCECHGPVVVMTTQTLRTEKCLSPGDDGSQSNYLLLPYEEFSDSTAQEETLYGKETLVNSLTESTITSGCAGCWSLGPAKGAIFSSHERSSMSYVSTQNGLGTVVKLAREAALKSISCEVLPSKTGCMLYTNSPGFAVLAETFLVKDFLARGFQRYFSVIVGNKEKNNALRSMTAITKKITDLIKLIRGKCEETYILESDGFENEDTSTKDFLKKRPGDEPLRNLSELASDPTLFLVVHKSFTEILSELENLRTDAPVAGQPVKCSLLFDESRILVMLDIVNSFPVNLSKVLLYCLLAGRAVEIRCLNRDTGRIVANALSSVLPNNKGRDSMYFANVVLSTSENNEFDYILHVVSGSSSPTFNFHSKVCTCGIAVNNCCKDCMLASSSTAVGQMFSLLSCSSLTSETVHTKILSHVQGILHHAKVWSKLKSGPDKRTFLRKFGLGASDGQILNFFQMFLA